jgi:hypothetical protein
MATFSVYPLDRGKGTKGKVVLRLQPSETRLLIAAKGKDYFENGRFVLRGTIKPFRCEILLDQNGTKFFKHGEGRWNLYVRFEDLTPLNPGDDLCIKNLIVRVDGPTFLVMQTQATKFGATRRHAKRRGSGLPALATPPAPPALPASVPAVAPSVPTAAPDRFTKDITDYKEMFNQLLDEHRADLVEVIIQNGRIVHFRLRHDIVI